jgi:hypothetical protein
MGAAYALLSLGVPARSRNNRKQRCIWTSQDSQDIRTDSGRTAVARVLSGRNGPSGRGKLRRVGTYGPVGQLLRLPVGILQRGNGADTSLWPHIPPEVYRRVADKAGSLPALQVRSDSRPGNVRPVVQGLRPLRQGVQGAYIWGYGI